MSGIKDNGSVKVATAENPSVSLLSPGK
eukprot:COSAG05_NODE_22936_length_261_cov_0.641975_1_plen_27_part_10